MKSKLKIGKLLAIAVIALFSISASECEQKGPVPASSSGIIKKNTTVATDSEGWTVEQKNVADRLKIDNLPGAIKHLYVISPYSGQTIIYSTVKGKVTSGGKRLSPTTVVVGASGDWKEKGFDAPGGTTTSEVLQDDGTYGSSSEYVFWFDAKNQYHQHFFTGGQIIHVSEQPLPVKGVIINVSGVQE